MSIEFDHIKVHISDIKNYYIFLQKIFQGGTYKVISDSGTSLFISPDGINIEIEKKVQIIILLLVVFVIHVSEELM